MEIYTILWQIMPRELLSAIRRIRLVKDTYSFDMMNKLYNSCDVYVDAGIQEGFCMPIVEAIGCGKPVITNSLAPLSHLASETFSNVDELITLMRKRDPNRKEVPGDYTWDSIVKKLSLLF